jgi:AcrR family transcriptional regulator
LHNVKSDSGSVMARRPSYNRRAVIESAREVFSERGVEMTSIADLEEHTGLNRSSLYNEFGSKDGLFEAALRSYLEQGIQSRLGSLSQPSAGLTTVAAFFSGMGQTFRADPERGGRGCLMVNTVAELGAHDPRTALASSYRDAFRSAFRTALRQAAVRQEMSEKRVRSRADLLASMTMGLFITARIDPMDAARVCDDVAAEVKSWRLT